MCQVLKVGVVVAAIFEENMSLESFASRFQALLVRGLGLGPPRVVVHGSLFMFSVCFLLKHSTLFSVLLARFSSCHSLRSFTFVL